VVLVDRKTSAKQFYIKKCQDGSVEVKVASPGSIISNEITQKDILEFYLTSCKSNNKEPPVTHYQCYHIDYIKEDMTRTQYFKKLQDLTYKLCFLYYNNSGSISIPAPLKYAIRLVKLVQDLSASDVVVPKEHYEITNGLYFI
jgi:aubergine-like protein